LDARREATLFGFAVLALDPADGARTGTHHDAFGRHHAALEPLDAVEQRTIGHASRSENAIALREFLEIINIIEIGDAPAARAAALVVVAEQQPPL